jgi:uncharacterized Zn-binding protein involved in type VI secretion
MPPAARITDTVAHPLPPILTGGPTATTVLIGFLPAWRGVNPAVAAAMQAAKAASDAVIAAAEAATLAAAGTPGAPAAKAAEETLQGHGRSYNGKFYIVRGGRFGYSHVCDTIADPPHGPGIVITPSATVMIQNFPAARMGDTILEAVGPPNKITKGEMTVIIGG